MSNSLNTLKYIFNIASLLILTSFILQFIALLGNFDRLKSVYMISIQISENSGGGLIAAIVKSVVRKYPDYLSLSPFKICEGYNTVTNNATSCSPASFGYSYTSDVDILNTIQSALPAQVHTILSLVLKVIFIPSIIICFILLIYSYAYQRDTYQPQKKHRLIFICVAGLSIVLCIITFAIHVAIYYLIQSELKTLGSSFEGGEVLDAITLTIKFGASTWMSLVAFLCLMVALVYLFRGDLFRCCPCYKKNSRKEMPMIIRHHHTRQQY